MKDATKKAASGMLAQMMAVTAMIVIAGVALPIPSAVGLVSVVIFLALRTTGKVLGGRIATIVAPGELPPRAGLGLLPSSAVALGLALDFQASSPPSEIAGIVLTIVVLGSFFSETAGLWTTWILARAHIITEATVSRISTPLTPATGEPMP